MSYSYQSSNSACLLGRSTQDPTTQHFRDKDLKTAKLNLQLPRKVVFSCLVFFLTTCFYPSNCAAQSVGANISRVGGTQQVTVSLLHAPYSQVVVLDQDSRVVAAGLDRGQGLSELTFRISNQVNQLYLLVVDQADQTNRVPIPLSGVSGLLMPPTLVFDPEVVFGDASLGVGGYAHPQSRILLDLSKSGQLVRTDLTQAAIDGSWAQKYENLEEGEYSLTARASLSEQTSLTSLPLEFTVTKEADPLSKAATQVGDQVTKVVQSVLPAQISKAASKVAPQAEQVGLVVTPVASAGLLAQLSMLMRDLAYWVVQAVISGLQYFGFWRKRHPWGLVYDAVTKQPVMLATVRLYHIEGATKRLVETDVTSKAGVFSFFPKAGNYLVQAAKTGYNFPSRLVIGRNDGEYAGVYHGETISFSSEKSIVDVAVPLDPVDKTVGLKFRIANILRTRIYLVTLALLMVGWLMSAIGVVGGSGGINGFLLIFYSGLLIGHVVLVYRKSKAWGQVVDADGNPVKGVQLGLMDPKFEKLVQRRVTDDEGKYQFVVPEGEYEIRVETVGWSIVTGLKKAYSGQKIVVTGNKPKLIALRMMIVKEA